MKPARVQTKVQLEALVSKLNDHSKRVAAKLVEAKLIEAGEAAPAGGSAPPAAPASAASPAPAPPKGTPASPTEEKPAADGEEAVGVKAVVDQLNAIRGGQSFKEQKVMDELTRYFDGLEQSEQEALHAYLKGLAQIVSGQVEAGAAEEPSDHGVDMQASGKKTRNIKPNVTRKASTPAAAPVGAPVTKTIAPSKEDTTAPAPIIPKKR